MPTNNNTRMTVAKLGIKVDNIEKRFDRFEMIVCKKIDDLREDVQELNVNYIKTHTQTKSLKERLDTLGSRLWAVAIGTFLSLLGLLGFLLRSK